MLATLLLLASPAFSNAADVADVQLALEENGVYASFALKDAFAEEVTARIRSGLETSFLIHVRLDRERGLWFDRQVNQREVRLSCTYDNLASVYHITKSLDGAVFESVVVDTETEMHESMSRVRKLKVVDNTALQHNTDYVLKVKADLLSRYVLLVVPWDIDTPWREKRFTFN